MKNLSYVRPNTCEEASGELTNGSVIMAGGSDLLGGLKADIYPQYPEKLVSLKGISGLEGIREEEGGVRIGAMTKLTALTESKIIREKFPMVAEAAHSVATPLIRNIATIGGNICQDVRCWFYRYPHEIGGRLDCARKGGEICYGIQGDNRYHSIFGGMKTGVTPCSAECPAGTDIPAYMEQIRKDNWEEAARIIMRANPLPMLTSRVCPHTCQEHCNQCKNGDSVSIHSVERALGDYILEHADRFYQAPEKETGKKTGIVGAGPAGLTAAYFLRKQGHAVTVYDKMEEAGGVLMYGIPEYRLPKHYVRDVVKAIAGMGVQFVMNTCVGEDITIEQIEQENDTVFLDTGAWKQPILGIEGENMTQFGLNFLVEVKKFMTRQIGKEVLVCGGGNVAMDVALTAVRLGAQKVKLVCLEQRRQMPATEEEIQRALEEGVELINGRGLKKVVYEGDRIIGLETKKCTAVRDEQGRFAPQYDESDVTLIESDCIILATGQRVDLDFLGERFKEQIQSARGLIEVGEHNDTRRPGVYAGGDAATGPSVAIRAIRAGANAAISMSRYMGCPMEGAHSSAKLIQCDTKRIHDVSGVVEKDTPAAQRCLDKEDSATLSREEAKAEAGRCMNCGCYSVNASDLTPVLLALHAVIKTTRREISAEDLFTTKLKVTDMLDQDEIVTEVILPFANAAEMHYDKFCLRDSVDFAMVSLASIYDVENGVIKKAGLVLGGVAPVPMRREKAEEYLIGKAPTEENAEKAAELALEDATPFEKNAYKVDIAKSMIKRSVLRLA
ncbi:MAG: FAD-dependent oxidoreductase [Enterocloster sp.]